MDGDRQSEVGWRRARNARARSDLLRQHAVSAARTGAGARDPADAARSARATGVRTAITATRSRCGSRACRRLVALVRHELRRWLDDDGVASEDQVDITLACSEACANAVEHPGRPGRLAFEVEARREDGELLLSVRDFGAWTDATLRRDARPRPAA